MPSLFRQIAGEPRLTLATLSAINEGELVYLCARLDQHALHWGLEGFPSHRIGASPARKASASRSPAPVATGRRLDVHGLVIHVPRAGGLCSRGLMLGL